MGHMIAFCKMWVDNNNNTHAFMPVAVTWYGTKSTTMPNNDLRMVFHL
jgi:hypothetical protein